MSKAYSGSSCSDYSYCKHTKYYGNGGHHKKCECGFRFNCHVKPHDNCKRDEYKCRRCCIKSVHNTMRCIDCNDVIVLSCMGDYLNYFGEFVHNEKRCEECKTCNHCGIQFYKTEHGYEYDYGTYDFLPRLKPGVSLIDGSRS
jgi:hypothetical protein